MYLMSPPGPGWAIRGRANFRSQEAQTVSPLRARKEWLALAEAIEAAGATVVVLPPTNEPLTGLPYAAEAGHVLPPKAGSDRPRFLLPRMFAPHRILERDHWAPLAATLGFEVIDLGAGIWEGQGDVASFDGTTILFYGGRTDRAGLKAALAHFDGEVLVIELRQPAFHGNMALLPLPAADKILVAAAFISLVELDPHMTRLFSDLPLLTALNGGALRSPKLEIVNADAFGWLEGSDAFFDVIVIDFPDPTNFSIGKLYTTSFYALVDRHLAADGFAVVQTTSPLVARRSFLTITPYHAHVPSFGEWGFIVAGRRPFRAPTALPPGLRFLTVEGFAALLQFPPDMARVPMPPNRLSDQSLVHTFEAEWGRVHQ